MVSRQSQFTLFQSRLRSALQSCLVISLLIATQSSLYAASVTASLNKNVVTENSLVQLTLRADFSDTGNGPELSPLQKDFEILGKSQNSQFSFNLGTSKALNFWVISLMPKSVGTLEIPPIKIGDHQSQAIKLQVNSAPQLLDDNGNPPVIMKLQASNVEPYLQQQVILSVKLYTSVALQNANRSVPAQPNLVIERLIDDQMNYETINGTQYQVITREYLSFPQRSGPMTIPPQSVQAMINTSSGRKLIKVQSEPLNLQVLPIPASYTADSWLPSEEVAISTKLTAATDTPRIGDTLMWEINVRAKGSLPEQIPTLDFNSTRQYKLYPQPPKFSNQKTIIGVTGEQNIQVEVVPTAEGELILPDIDITYWNTKTRQIAHAKAKTQGVTIAALPTGQITPTKPDIDTSPLPAQPSSTAPISLVKKPEPAKAATLDDQASMASALEQQESTSLSPRDWVIYALLTVAGLLLIAGLYKRFKKSETDLPTETSVPTLQEFAPLSTPDEASAFNILIQCCRQNQLSELRANLLEWARHRWGDHEIRTLDDIKRLTSVQVTQLLMEAELMMYSNNPLHEWQGNPLADALEEYSSGQAKPSQASQLKALYPNF